MIVRLVSLSIIAFVVVLVATDSLLSAACAVLAGCGVVLATRALDKRRRP